MRQEDCDKAVYSLEQLRVENEDQEEHAAVLTKELEAELLKCQSDFCGLEQSMRDITADRDALREKMDTVIKDNNGKEKDRVEQLAQRARSAHRVESTQDELDKATDAPLAVEDYFPIIEFTKKETNKVQRSAPPRSSVLTCAEADTMMDMEEKETLVRRKESQGEREITCDNALKIDEAHVNATIKLTAERNETIAVMVKEKEDLVQQRDEACRVKGNALATATTAHEPISFGLSATDWFKVEFTDLLKQMDDIHKSLRADLDDLHQKTDSMERHKCSLVMSIHETNALHAGSRQGDQRERDLETILVAELDAMRQTKDVMSKEKNLLSVLFFTLYFRCLLCSWHHPSCRDTLVLAFF